MKILNRNEVDIQTTWDLSSLFSDNESCALELESLLNDVTLFNTTYKTKLTDAQTTIKALHEYMALLERMTSVGTYASLTMSEDSSNPDAQVISGKASITMNQVSPLLNFVTQEIRLLEDAILNEIKSLDDNFSLMIDEIIKEKPHMLTPEIEDVLSTLAPTLNSHYHTYNMHKLIDMKFDNVTTDNHDIPMSFGYFEDELMFHEDTDVRRKAFDTFHKRLKGSENTVAAIYGAHVQKEKAMAKLKGFDNTIDYLLFDQDVTRDMYDRQIDLIMEHLAPAMRKFAKQLQSIHKLDKMTYSDLHLVVDPTFEPNYTIEDSHAELLKGLSILGDDYLDMINRAFDERWIDFPQNAGKSTGAFCSSPYGRHPYILISWTSKMREVFVLAHELGHAGHFYLAGQNQNILNVRPSLYFIEAPSTMNELLMANHLNKSAEDDRLKRWILSTLISRTYYHNFVTHLIEAAFQREVYRTIDANKPLNANVLNTLFKEVLTTFWGDAVEITEGAELTWMRQPHYYMGLYPYTYSAGLTVATQASDKLLNDEISIEDWKNVLKAGGTKSPLDLAKMVNIDLSTEEPLLKTIQKISDMIDEIEVLTDNLNK